MGRPRSAADPLVGLVGGNFSALNHYFGVMLYQRRLPHIWATEQPVFLTWRLHGSLPPHRPFLGAHCPPGRRLQHWAASWTRPARVRSTFDSQPLPT